MYERSHVSVKSRTSLNFTFNLNTLYLVSILFTCVNVRSQKRINGNQPQVCYFIARKFKPSLPQELGKVACVAGV